MKFRIYPVDAKRIIEVTERSGRVIEFRIL